MTIYNSIAHVLLNQSVCLFERIDTSKVLVPFKPVICSRPFLEWVLTGEIGSGHRYYRLRNWDMKPVFHAKESVLFKRLPFICKIMRCQRVADILVSLLARSCNGL